MGVNPYRDAGWLTAQQARELTISNIEKMLQRRFEEVMQDIHKACEKGDHYIILHDRLLSDTIMRLNRLGYKVERIWETAMKVHW